ncbi:MAG: hypothetical protein ACTSWY_00120 [Promethearchaeota archaeon]
MTGPKIPPKVRVENIQSIIPMNRTGIHLEKKMDFALSNFCS